MSGESAILTQFEFQFDPTKIPVDEIVEEWRAQSTKGCYESAMWRAAGLEEPAAGSHSKRGPRSSHNDEDMAAHGDEHAAFRYAMGWGPDDYRPAPRVIPAAPTPAPAAAAPASAAPVVLSYSSSNTGELIHIPFRYAISLHIGVARISNSNQATRNFTLIFSGD
jgi:hypothetical protein